MKEIISKVSKNVIPSKTIEKSKKEIADLAFKLVEKEIEKYPEVTGLEFGGSFAKDTWLPEDADIDIFVRFKIRKNFKKDRFQLIKKIFSLCQVF